MPTLDEMLADSAKYPDNTPMVIGDTQIPLGSLRAASAAQLAKLENRVKEIDARDVETKRRFQETLELSTKAQQAYDAAEAARKSASTATPTLGADPFADPWLSPVKSELDKRDKTLAEMKSTLENAVKMLNSAAVTWAEDRWDSEYNSIDWGKRPADKRPARDDLVKYANENKLMDRRGMPSIKLAWERQSAQERIADREAAAELRGRELGRQEAMAARIPPPGVPGAAPLPGAPAGKPNAGELGDLYTQSLEDSELRALLEQLPGAVA